MEDQKVTRIEYSDPIEVDITRRRRESMSPSYSQAGEYSKVADVGFDVPQTSVSKDLAAKQAMLPSENTNILDIAGKAGMGSGNPAAVAAGAGLEVLSANMKAKNEQEKLAYMARENQKQAVRNSLDGIISVLRGGAV